MSETVTDPVAWCLLLADLWQVYAVSCFIGLLQRLLNGNLANWQWALARCLRKWLLRPRLAVEMREEALNELCVAFGTCLLADETALGIYPALRWVAQVFAGTESALIA